MFRLVEKKSNNYLVLDTDDGVVDELDYFQILKYLEYGIEIEGCVKTTRGYHFEIDNSDSEYVRYDKYDENMAV